MAQLSYPLDNTLYTAAYPQFWLSTRTRGVYSSDDLSTVVSGGMQITISIGVAWMKFSRLVSAGFANTTPVNFTLDMADGIYRRIDRVVVRWDNILNTITLKVKKGIPAGTPVAMPLQNDADAVEMGIADITIPAGVLQISQSNVKDTRLDESLCGIMRDGVTGIPTQTLYDQWWAWFKELKLDAETKAQQFADWMVMFKTQNESDLTAWVSSFKTTHEAEINDWISSFEQENTSIMAVWTNNFMSQSETEFQTWFDGLVNTLDENQASSLYNKIDQHERTTAATQPDGVHGIRVTDDGKIQYFIGIGWATVAQIEFGYHWKYIDALDETWLEWDYKELTWDQLEKLIEVEG